MISDCMRAISLELTLMYINYLINIIVNLLFI